MNLILILFAVVTALPFGLFLGCQLWRGKLGEAVRKSRVGDAFRFIKAPKWVIAPVAAVVALLFLALIHDALGQSLATQVAAPNANFSQEIYFTDVNSNFTDAPTNSKPTNWTGLAFGTNLILGGTLTNIPPQPFYVRPGEGVALTATITNTSGDAVTFNLNATVDGVHWSSLTNWSWTCTENGAGTNTFTTNIPWMSTAGFSLDGYRAIEFMTASNNGAGTVNANILNAQIARGVPWSGQTPTGF